MSTGPPGRKWDGRALRGACMEWGILRTPPRPAVRSPPMAPSDPVHIYIVSDGTGATAAALVKAGLVLFQGMGELGDDVKVTRFPKTLTKRGVERVAERAAEEYAFVVHTFC